MYLPHNAFRRRLYPVRAGQMMDRPKRADHMPKAAPQPEKVTTMQAIAKLAGLSRGTVSDVINDRWRQKGITRKTFDRVQKIIELHHYSPNNVARSLANGKTHNIGVQLPSSLYEHWTNVQNYLELALRRQGYYITLASASCFHHDECDEIRRLCHRQVDGLILSPERGYVLHPLFDWMKRRGMPFVFLGDTPYPGHYSVTDDNISQVRLAIDHLVSLGHRRIGYLHGASSTVGERERRRGYLEAMKANDLPIHTHYVRRATYLIDQAAEAMYKLMDQPNPPTAVYCAADTTALGAIEGAMARGLSVPHDVAIVGHADDIPFIRRHAVPLTTVRQARQQLAERSVEMLLDLINGQKPKDVIVRLKGQLIVRDSCGVKLGARVFH